MKGPNINKKEGRKEKENKKGRSKITMYQDTGVVLW